MAQCKQPVTISTIYECATFCDKWNTPPIPKFVFERNMLIQKCDFFDSGIIQNRLFKWEFRCDGYLFYETDWGGMNDYIIEMNNGSTYGTLKLGLNHVSIVNFFNSLPHTILTTTDTVVVTLKVTDCDGIQNSIESNKYKFNKK